MAEEIALTAEEHRLFSRQVSLLSSDLEVYDDRNGHCSDRYKKAIDRLSICHSWISDDGELVISIHIFGKNCEELKAHVTKISSTEIDLDFEIGEFSASAISLLKEEFNNLLKKIKASAEKKRQKVKTKFGTKNWSGLYLYRGSIDEMNEWFENFEEAVRLNIASPEFIQSMKDWNLHFRDY